MSYQEKLQTQGVPHKVITKLPAQTEIQKKFLKQTGQKKAIHQPRFKPPSATDGINTNTEYLQERFKNEKYQVHDSHLDLKSEAIAEDNARCE